MFSHQIANRTRSNLKAVCILAGALGVPTATAAQQLPALSQEEQLEQLGQANIAAIAYAEEHGAALLLHVGMDVQNHPEAEAYLQWIQDEFKARFAAEGVTIQVFPRMNDAIATGLVAHIGSHIYTPANSDDPILDLDQAAALVPDIAQQARFAIELMQD